MKKSSHSMGVKQALAVNFFYITKSVYQLYARATFYRYQKKVRRILLLLFLILTVAAGVVYLLWQTVVLTVILLLLGFYFLGMFFFGYLLGATREYNDLKQKYPDAISMATGFYDDFFEVRLNDKPTVFRYEQIMDLIETNDLWILMIGDPVRGGFGQILLRESYTLGSEDIVRNLFMSKASIDPGRKQNINITKKGSI